MDSSTPSQPAPAALLPVPVTSPWCLYLLMALNGLLFVPSLKSDVWRFVLAWGGLIPFAVLDYHQFWRLVTAGFLHSNLVHIATNLYALYYLGRRTEQLWGAGRFVVGYFFALLSSSLLVIACAGRDSLTVGASGALMGLIGMLLVFSYTYRQSQGESNLFGNLLTLALINLGIGLLPGISLWGHLGGLLGGLVIGWALCPRYQAVMVANNLSTLSLKMIAWGQRETSRLGLVLGGWVVLLGLVLWLR